MRFLLTRGRIPYLVLLALIVPWCVLEASRVGVERNNESLVARDPAQDALYEKFRATFGSDEDVLVAVHHPRLLELSGLRLVGDLTDRIAALPGVRSVYSLTNAQQIVAGEAGAEPAPLLVPPFDVASTRAALDRNPDLTGLFISPDRETAGILVEIEDRADDHEYRGALIRSLRAIAAEVTDDGVSMHLTGIAVQKNDVSEFIARDTRWLMPLAVVVLAVVLGVFFRHPLGVVLPLGVTGITVAATMAAYGRAGFQVNAITALLPPVLMVLSLAVSVHVIQGWLEAPPGAGQRRAHPRRRAPSALSVLLLRGDHRDRLRLARHQSDARGATVRRLRRVRHPAVVRRRHHPGAGRAHVPHAAGVAARRAAPSPGSPRCCAGPRRRRCAGPGG